MKRQLTATFDVTKFSERDLSSLRGQLEELTCPYDETIYPRTSVITHTAPRPLEDVRRQLAAREPCEDDHGAGRGAFMPCPGWRIDEVDGAPVTRQIGRFFITRCDACAPADIMDDDLEQLPEAIEALRRVEAAANARAEAEAAKARPRDALASAIDRFCEDPIHVPDDPTPLRTVAITVLVVTDASCEDIAKAFGGVLDEADIATYQLGVAPVGAP